MYLYKGVPVAFINYSFSQQWYKRLPFTEDIGPNAHIHHIAVEDEYQKKGFGTALLADAIADCKSRSANCIVLGTSDRASTFKLHNFYTKHGFFVIQHGTYAMNGSRWKKPMGPPPIIVMGKNATKAFKACISKLK